MRKRPTAAQQRGITAADPVTGLLDGPEALLDALVRRQLAFRHPRPPHHAFLTPSGHRLRDELLAEPPPEPRTASLSVSSTPSTPSASSAPGVFAARTGTEPASAERGARRAREVHSAWQGLVEMRRLTNPQADTSRPCLWERAHLVQAAALALEAAHCRPATSAKDATGYQVSQTPQPEAVRISWQGEDAAENGDPGLPGCARALEQAGWQVSTHADRRSGSSYLLASPRRR
jgi:hypothetical protein